MVKQREPSGVGHAYASSGLENALLPAPLCRASICAVLPPKKHTHWEPRSRPWCWCASAAAWVHLPEAGGWGRQPPAAAVACSLGRTVPGRRVRCDTTAATQRGGEAGMSEEMHLTAGTPLLIRMASERLSPTIRPPSLGRHLLGLRGAGQNGGPNGGIINPVRDRLDAQTGRAGRRRRRRRHRPSCSCPWRHEQPASPAHTTSLSPPSPTSESSSAMQAQR